MIFYFSGTGNSRRIALRLAGLTADKAVDIVSLTDIPDPKTERRIGLVFPVYAWGLPEPVEAFLERLPAADVYTFAVTTCGADAGHALEAEIPLGRLTAVTGVSGSGKTTLILESLVPALQAFCSGKTLPPHVRSVSAPGIRRVCLIDADPVGINVRSTAATYSGVLDELRRLYAGLPEAKAAGLKASDFSYNTGSLRCSGCDGTGQITMDVQFLPDVETVCPDCGGSRYGRDAQNIRLYPAGDAEYAQKGIPLPELLGMTVRRAVPLLSGVKGAAKARGQLQTLDDLGLGYLTPGEATPALSGGEAQRLKLAAETGRAQQDTVFVFDEPTIGLHPLDVRQLIAVFQRLLDAGATVVVIEHDLDLIANADYVIDMGPGGGQNGGRITARGTPEEIAADTDSVTGKYLREILRK